MTHSSLIFTVFILIFTENNLSDLHSVSWTFIIQCVIKEGYQRSVKREEVLKRFIKKWTYIVCFCPCATLQDTHGGLPVYTPQYLLHCRWLLCTCTLLRQTDMAYGSPVSGHLAGWASGTWLHLWYPSCFCTRSLWANKVLQYVRFYCILLVLLGHVWRAQYIYHWFISKNHNHWIYFKFFITVEVTIAAVKTPLNWSWSCLFFSVTEFYHTFPLHAFVKRPYWPLVCLWLSSWGSRWIPQW